MLQTFFVWQDSERLTETFSLPPPTFFQIHVIFVIMYDFKKNTSSPFIKPTVQSSPQSKNHRNSRDWRLRKGGEALFDCDIHPGAPAEWVFSSCVQTGCRTGRAPCRWHTSDQAAASSEGRRGYRGSWHPWMELQAPDPGPFRRTKHKNIFYKCN